MKENKKLEWIEEGYRLVAEHGFKSINIESIARAIGKNKSSFYHYFGDTEIYQSELLDYHLERSETFANQVSRCKNMKPDLVNIFVDHKTDLFFHKWLRINRANPEYKKCFERVFENYENAILEEWANFLGLEQQRLFAQTFLHLIAENFLLQITWETYNYDWLSKYLDEISDVLQQMNSAANK